jgi:hypothetical protein
MTIRHLLHAGCRYVELAISNLQNLQILPFLGDMF